MLYIYWYYISSHYYISGNDNKLGLTQAVLGGVGEYMSAVTSCSSFMVIIEDVVAGRSRMPTSPDSTSSDACLAHGTANTHIDNMTTGTHT